MGRVPRGRRPTLFCSDASFEGATVVWPAACWTLRRSRCYNPFFFLFPISYFLFPIHTSNAMPEPVYVNPVIAVLAARAALIVRLAVQATALGTLSNELIRARKSPHRQPFAEILCLAASTC